MAPFHKAIELQPTSQNSGENERVYQGLIDPEWVVVKIPHGGYILALLVDAVINFQSTTPHKDPIHVTAHFLRPSAVGNFEIRVRVLKSGKGFTNLTAELFQKNTLKVTTHMIFAHNGPVPGDKANLTLQSPSAYARRVPLYLHPSTAPRAGGQERWNFQPHIEWTREPDIEAKNKPNHPNRTDRSSIGGEGVEWGSWFGFSDKEEKITSTSIAFLVDIFSNLPSLLPRSERKGLVNSWFPTVTLSIEFKAPIPPPSEYHASRTVGVYSNGKFMHHPQGRHDAYVEIWTAPTNIGEGEPLDGWRDKQVCLAISTQMALAIPFDEASKRADRETARL
ncbi:hypothetical protein P691DRAFT_712009 [Macrolepiota fuliginosa MF-IS2]|uniref:Thioesterase family protein n=1 Tax=Macrolepiota fuliginosa MF-IS2 TaxID=1400762 RepID=A0A9P5X3V0_9AGAR|nr:hypothetical protein P691DRAFT_712009 [Macrolepiota fuliginosa MF-IS2]